MPLQRYVRSLARIAMAGIGFSLLAGCAKDPLQVDRNRAPRTYVVAAPGSAVVRDTMTASYRVHLYWRGEDPDGYVAGFLWAFDDSSIGRFRYTTKTDSIFELTVNDSALVAGGSQLLGVSRIHTFFVRAVDNLGKADPDLAVWNRRLYRASTFPPTVRFVGQYPSDPSGNVIDTLTDGGPFTVCWSGSDSDGVVTRYKYDVGAYSSGLRTDSCAVFNDPTVSGSVGLGSGLYSMTVTAVDNANAVGRNSFFFVVNHDPETWFEPKGSPIGHYIQPFLEGSAVNIQGTFADGETVPYRSTIWFTWDGEDVTGGESNIITGWNLNLRNGTRNNGEPYTIGFLDEISPGPPPIRFKTNDPSVVGPLGFTSLILDSLDAGPNMYMLTASRDGSNRTDGTPAAFRFNCNYHPELRGSLTVADTLAVVDPAIGLENCKVIYWTSYDFEDGQTVGARVVLDGQSVRLLSNRDQFIVVPDRTFQALLSVNPHSVTVRVIDRAEFESVNTLSIQFDVP